MTSLTDIIKTVFCLAECDCCGLPAACYPDTETGVVICLPCLAVMTSSLEDSRLPAA